MVRFGVVLTTGLVLGLSLFVFAKTAPEAVQGGVVRLQQGWDGAHEQNYYYTSQGSVILPVSWLAALNAPDGAPVTDPNRLKRLGFIYDDRESPANPNHWPIGFAVDSNTRTTGSPTVGLTCAACHSSQLTYRGTRMRVDGGQSHIDLDAFKTLVTDAIVHTGADPARRAAFEERAVALGFPSNQINAQFESRYKSVRRSIPYLKAIAAHRTLAGLGRADALAVGAQVLYNTSIGVPSNTNHADGPVDFPYLWNIWNLNWVQYNGSLRQPMSRNIGEALGVGAITHFVDGAGNTLPVPDRWRTSVKVQNLAAIETLLTSLNPPRWPQAIFGSVNFNRAKRGSTLFAQNCAACHGVRLIGNASSQEWSVRVLPLKIIGTDPMQANNWRLNRYDGTKLGLSNHANAATGLQAVTTAIREQAYKDGNVPRSEWPKLDGFGRPNDMTSPCGYKARPLVGTWATPPFLHNGSVPSVFALLSESRPGKFRFGGSEYDPIHLGIAESALNTSTFDASLRGNSNAGHWFTNDRSRPGRIGRAFSDSQKYDLVEYLKSATFASYPRTIVATADPEPCVDVANSN